MEITSHVSQVLFILYHLLQEMNSTDTLKPSKQ